MNHSSKISGFSPTSLLTRAELLDHAKHPRNRGVLETPDVIQEEANPLCGDVVTIYAKVGSPKSPVGVKPRGGHAPLRGLGPLRGEQGTVNREATAHRTLLTVHWTGSGCLISQAAASMLTEHVVGTSIEDVLRMERADVERLLGSSLSPSRVKCAMLALVALKNGIQRSQLPTP
ncbi:MAG: iron-sulfur cluster assembly scaffold protein [bacterium]|nr:iron-sulfur cluster assembly scaffold protein [bacterium]